MNSADTLLRHGVKRLYTRNLKDFREFGFEVLVNRRQAVMGSGPARDPEVWEWSGRHSGMRCSLAGTNLVRKGDSCGCMLCGWWRGWR